eukprot:m.438398 g.438398  ORF g.438398 m.438398 type:complete len:334 (-) comp18232_c0_seq1:73-1074(-)
MVDAEAAVIIVCIALAAGVLYAAIHMLVVHCCVPAPPKVLMDNGTFESTGYTDPAPFARSGGAYQYASTSMLERSMVGGYAQSNVYGAPYSRRAPPQQAWPTPAPTDREMNLHKEPLYNSSIAETSFIGKERTPAAEPNAPSTARGSDASVATKPTASTATTASNEAQEAEELLTDQLLEIAAARRRAEVYSEASRLKQEQESAAAKEKDNERARELTNARLRREAEQKARDAEKAQKEALARQKREAEEKGRNAERAQKQAQQRKAEAAEAAEKARVKKQRDAEREHQRKLNSKKEGEERERRAAEARAAAQEKRDEEEKEKRKRILAQMAM